MCMYLLKPCEDCCEGGHAPCQDCVHATKMCEKECKDISAGLAICKRWRTVSDEAQQGARVDGGMLGQLLLDARLCRLHDLRR